MSVPVQNQKSERSYTWALGASMLPLFIIISYYHNLFWRCSDNVVFFMIYCEYRMSNRSFWKKSTGIPQLPDKIDRIMSYQVHLTMCMN